MYTLQSLAKEIETIQPDLKEFLATFYPESGAIAMLLKSIDYESSLPVKLLKIELLLTYIHTHPRAYSIQRESELKKVLIDNINYPQTSVIYQRNWNQFRIYSSFKESIHCLYHVKDVNKYLPKYLKNRIKPEKIG